MKGRSSHLIVTLVLAIVPAVFAQDFPRGTLAVAGENSEQVAKILGIAESLSRARAMHAQIPCGLPANVEELSMREDIFETVTAASLDIDGVLAELDNERALLSELSARLQARRDRSVNIANIANLVTGTGVGIGVNALQFSNSTANIGNGLGVASGIGSTLLSIIGIRRQHGPVANIGRVPNMLAPLFGKPPKLNTYYSPEVLAYLHIAPAGAPSDAGSRLDQLMAEWQATGRVGPPAAPQTEKKIALLTASSDKTKLSIDDLSDRISMLADVTGKVGLMKRDLASLMRSVRGEKTCPPAH